ncbi:hypothetical protein Z517_09390 [Fonsecaea pedrosoi CBS 271.37]|uniref:Uncharacterized protein n=1 Tax=Fonsecaea pedrosoi CBS 271.37 TaxID=1442368 RepID=A0A0D2DGZ7_9EURO|nr:uncharacterized protein Z517_09390 [Fonsecaea pedrosoi CBS 271.37]KIW76946.1 hypothetical protein Z517_09390 [Fonsecaea pedrosoi CBS 271.37]
MAPIGNAHLTMGQLSGTTAACSTLRPLRLVVKETALETGPLVGSSPLHVARHRLLLLVMNAIKTERAPFSQGSGRCHDEYYYINRRRRAPSFQEYYSPCATMSAPPQRVAILVTSRSVIPLSSHLVTLIQRSGILSLSCSTVTGAARGPGWRAYQFDPEPDRVLYFTSVDIDA